MTLTTIPDIDHIVGNYLATHPDIVAIVGASRVVAEAPKNTDAAWIRLTMLNARSAQRRTEYLIESYFQLDCYSSKGGYSGSQQADAARLALAARAVLKALPDADVDGTVSAVDIRGHARIPDTTYEPSRQRYVLTASVWTHR